VCRVFRRDSPQTTRAFSLEIAKIPLDKTNALSIMAVYIWRGAGE